MNVKAFHLSTQGASHIKKNKECQDASASYYDENCAIAIVCDGHGGDDYFRSAIGSKAGAEVAEKNIKDFITNVDKKTFFSKPEAHMKNLEASIINDWNESVMAYHKEHPFTDEELSGISERARKRYQEGRKIESAYGTTMIAVAMNHDYWFGIHIGDGKCVAVNPAGEFKQPIPWDPKCFLNATTSICDSDAIERFRHFYSEKLPAAVFVGSDGIDDCFRNNEQLHNLYKTVIYSFATSSFEEACDGLADYLPRLSAKGSGDDVSVSALLDLDLIPELTMIKEYDREKEKARVEENARKEAEKNEEEKRRVEEEHARYIKEQQAQPKKAQPQAQQAQTQQPLRRRRAVRYCSYCGAQIDPLSNYCFKCGKLVKRKEEPEPKIIIDSGLDTIDSGTQTVEEIRPDPNTVPVIEITDVPEAAAAQESVGDIGLKPEEIPNEGSVDEAEGESAISIAGQMPARPEEVVGDDSDQSYSEKVEPRYTEEQAEEPLSTQETIASEDQLVEESVTVVPDDSTTPSVENLEEKWAEEEKKDTPVEVRWATSVEQHPMSGASFEIVTEAIEVVHRPPDLEPENEPETGNDDYRR